MIVYFAWLIGWLIFLSKSYNLKENNQGLTQVILNILVFKLYYLKIKVYEPHFFCSFFSFCRMRTKN